jgi:diguanylate cyclase (GGDEF)-like protein
MSVFAVLVGWNGKLLFRSDIDRATSERTLAYQATHDALTHLPNRRLFIERLEQELARGERERKFSAVLFLDLDLFKVINDSLGHVVGDELLIAAGKRIQECLTDREVAARLSGDEFTVLLPDLPTPQRAIEVAAGILRAFAVPFTLGPHEVFTTTSIGIALSETDDSPVNLIRHADIAMYRAKARGKARYEMFDPSMDLAAIRRLQLETELRRAIDKGELRVFYQPEVEIESGQLVGMEALVRWEHPERGLISPSAFIGVAEETGLILPIGRWVLSEACRQAKEWQQKYRPDLALMVAVNLSGKHFQQATLIEEVSDVLKRTGMDPGHLILEITESVAMEGAESTIEILTKLKSLGVLLAIDDFGTGFSSLSYLKRFPVDLLKIDKSFVDGVALKGPDTAIVQAVIALGHALGLKVIAEGVETPEQVAQLRALGSELGQGFYFGAPLSDDSQSGMPTLLAEELRWTHGA